MQSSLVDEIENYLEELGYDDGTTLMAMTLVNFPDGGAVLFEELSNECMIKLFKENFKIKYEASKKHNGMIDANAVNSDGTIMLFFVYWPSDNDMKPEAGTLIEIYKKCECMRITMPKEYATMHK